MKCAQLVNQIFRNIFPFLFIFFLVPNLKAESKRDTLVNRAWRDTLKLQKAQIYQMENGDQMVYFRPKPFQFIKYVPSDLYNLGKTTFSKKNLPTLGALIVSTAALVAVDQLITDGAKQFGRYIHLSAAHDFKPLKINIGGSKITVLDVPQNLNMAFYFLGEGWPSILIASGFYSYGLAANDYRALQTTSQLAEMFFTLAITTQFIKRISGRQSPFIAIEGPDGVPGGPSDPVPGGGWHPFPTPRHYQSAVSNHDAFPSGHMATAMATITILAGNYPDNKYIKPVGYSLMGLLGYAMLNNGVHWISDYPVAIAIGYTCGKIALSRGHQVIKKKGADHGASSSLTPVYLGEGGVGLKYRVIF